MFKSLVAASLLTAAITSVSGQITDDEPSSSRSLSSDDDANSCDNPWISIANQSDVDFYSRCPTLALSDSAFFVGHDFSGPFDVPNVRSVAKFSAGYLGPRLRGSDRLDDSVTQVSMPDLQSTTSGGVMLAYLTYLTSISFPKLETISGDLVVFANYNTTTLSFPSLRNVSGGVWFEGNFDSIELPALKSLSFLSISSIGGSLDCRALGANLSSHITFTPRENDVFTGLTCSTLDDANSFNSSNPESVASASAAVSSTVTATAASSTATETGTRTGTGAGQVTPTASTATSEAAVHIGSLPALLGSVGVAVLGGLLM